MKDRRGGGAWWTEVALAVTLFMLTSLPQAWILSVPRMARGLTDIKSVALACLS